MKRSVIFIVLAVAVIGAAGFYLYKGYFGKKSVEAWDLVPANSLIVYERDDCARCVDDLHKSPVYRIIETAAFYHKNLDSLRGSLKKIIPAAPRLLISFHAIKKDDFDFIFYVPELAQRKDEIVKVFSSKNYRTRQRNFNGITIHETSFGKQVFSWAFIGEVWTGSFTPFLIEDVVRTSVSSNGFRKNVNAVQKLSQVRDDGGNVYIQLNNFSAWLSLFYAPARSGNTALGQTSVLDIKSDPNSIVMNGFSVDTTDQSKYLLSIFRQQTPVPFNLKNLISNNTMALHSFGVSNGSLFQTDLSAYVKKHSKHIADSLNIIGSAAKVDLSRLYGEINDEVGLCFVESTRKQRYSKIMLIETNAVKPWVDTFEKLADRYSADTVFHEQFGAYTIGEIPLYRFPEKMFWPLVSGFDQSFYTSTGSMIMIAENIDDLKKFLENIEEDETWGKSVVHNKFLETTLLESNLSIYVNTPKVWNLISNQLQPRWKQFVADHPSLLRSIQLSAIQFSHLNNGYYTNVSIAYKDVDPATARDKFVTNFEHGIRDVYTVKSHIDRSDEILVQDSINDLRLISDDGNVLWKISIGDKITSDVSQIDFFSNGKLQYFFTTTSGLHVIDRLGNYVQPFPVLLSSIEYQFATVVDYDHSRKYRFLVADVNGKMWMYDKEVANLDGWHPKDAGGALATAPRHHRIKGKDYIIALRKDGTALLMNRRGELLKNFPLQLNGRVSGDYFLDLGNTLADTYFVVVTEDGFRIRFTVDGKIQSRETLLKTSIGSKFRLVAEKNMKSYFILQQDARNFTLTDESGKTLISNDAISGNRADVAYYDFGAGRTFVVVTDHVQSFSYIYDGSGTLITEPPVESNIVALRPAGNDENKLYSVQGRSLTITNLNH